jgi:2-keto-4-pentenoate hydratase/2-oxohepta-3-ene-1,7-dioic acid hydratase in catechol pathway
MKLVTYRVEEGIRHGVVRGAAGVETVVELGSGDLLTLLEAGPEGIARARSASGPERRLADVRLLAPLRRPPKLLALAANYQDHIVEGGGPRVNVERIVPKLFLKPSSAIIGPGEPLTLPNVSHEVDWELELAVVIGTRGRDVAAERALEMVAGYSIINDVSARTVDYGIERDDYAWKDFFDWLNGKWPDGFAPLGPSIVTSDEVPDPQNLQMRLSVNGELKQNANTRDMIFGVAATIAFASRFMTLEPGDVIATGTPSGVGETTGTYLKAGDVMEGSIDKLGTLRTPVRAPVGT